MSKSKKTNYLCPSPPPSRGGLSKVFSRLGTNQPDLGRNPAFWPLWLAFGPARLRTILAETAKAQDVADLGCGSGWLSLRIAAANPRVRVRAIDRNPSLLEWGQGYYEACKARDRKGRWGEIGFESENLVDCDFGAGTLDVAIASFSLGALADPLDVIDRLGRAIRPGGVLIYYDATEPPLLNLERVARWRHGWARFGGQMSDLWNQQRKAESEFLEDAVRRRRSPKRPPEEQVFHAIEESFEVFHQERCRAILDLKLESLSKRWVWLSLPAYKLYDDLAVASGWLEGSCRFLMARRR